MAANPVLKELREINQRIVFHREERDRQQAELDRLKTRRDELKRIKDQASAQ